MGMDALGLRRRRHVRGSLQALASLTFLGRRLAGPYHVENLSAGGALLEGHPVPNVDTAVEAQLHVPGLSPICVAGVVIRRLGGPAGRAIFALAFRDVSQDVEDSIQDAVLKSLEAARDLAAPAVLVVGASPEDRTNLAGDLACMGCHVSQAGSALGALRHLQDPRRPLDVVLACLEFRPISGAGFLALVEEAFPGVRRVLVAREADAEQARGALSAKVAHAVLFEPWDRRHLAAAVGISAAGA